uniref:non-specific serine/threonine protein kinase n=1 Tax=Scleropages formosus TaxID=113540 RepID=A0A8C9VCN6_SCLFO
MVPVGPRDCEEAVVVAPASEAMLSVTSQPKEASGRAEVHPEGNQGVLEPAEATCAVKETKSSHDCENPHKGRRRWMLKWKCRRSVDQGTLLPSKGNLKKLYTKGKLLGKGGYASVYEGIRKSDGLPVAIKFVSKRKVKWMKCPVWKEHLPVEVAMMKLVNAAPASPYVLNLIEWFDMTLKYALVLERPQACQSLTHFCKVQGGKLMEEQARPVMQQVIKALRHCQDRGVVHRDLKPPNLLIQPETLQVKLIDFGSAILLKDAEGQKIVGQ